MKFRNCYTSLTIIVLCTGIQALRYSDTNRYSDRPHTRLGHLGAMEEVNAKPLPSFGEIFRAFEKHLGFQNPIKWSSAIAIILYHVVAVYWCYRYTLPVKWQTVVFGESLFLFAF